MKLELTGTWKEIIAEMRDVLAAENMAVAAVLRGDVNPVPEDNTQTSEDHTPASVQGSGPEAGGSTKTDEFKNVAPEPLDNTAPSTLDAPKTPPVKNKGGRPKKPAPPKAAPVEEPGEEEAGQASLFEKTYTPAELAALREATTEELRAAYSGGKEKAVTKLLKQFGNGATSFRELSHDAFIPIRKAIDEGALA